MSQAGKLTEWERGGREKTDDSSLQEEQKDNTVAGIFFFLASARISTGIWQVGLYPEIAVFLVSLRNYSGFCDTVRGLFKFIFLWLMTWSVGKTRATGIPVLWISNCSSLILALNHILGQGQLETLNVENWWDVPWKGLLYIYPMPLPFLFFLLNVLWGPLSETDWERDMENVSESFCDPGSWNCCMFIRHLCLKAPAVLEAYCLS